MPLLAYGRLIETNHFRIFMHNYYSAVNQENILEEIDRKGFTCTPNLVPIPICKDLIKSYADDTLYRSTINMARYSFGQGQYRYFKYPLPNLINTLRKHSYDFLLPLARQWAYNLKQDLSYPDFYADYLRLCHQAGQARPTPLILRYEQGDYNCLHQDLYGELNFPLQLIVMLSDPHKDFDGGELVLTEQRPRMQSRAHVLNLEQGEAAIIAVNYKPKLGTRGYYRATIRHGVSELKKGYRHTMGVILHDAK